MESGLQSIISRTQMTDPITICNLALSKLGESPILNLLDPQSNTEQLCKQWYEPCRRSVLEDCDWSFARARATLDIKTDDEPFDYDYALFLPGDMLRVIRAYNPNARHDSNFRWEIQGNSLLCNYRTVNIIYTKDVTDSSRFSSMFVDALVARLAMELCIPVTQNSSHSERLTNEYLFKLQKAITTDGMQSSPEQTKASILKGARFRSAHRGGTL